ncbi:hypothetical protein GCM10011529_14420 [Polymorphobacter glacialis]|uniref:Energy transducer TonB n=1 Tax=Sandarakinorhabdus glacialis TaxID=1614636 RepID=A0A917E8B8_9SPHN|nr:hypothetical protein [Polymorphobacter glacialis]GGE09167.1 hypothetical protein GCM10011529_14420 [Polymorphobacter glacialis]
MPAATLNAPNRLAALLPTRQWWAELFPDRRRTIALLIVLAVHILLALILLLLSPPQSPTRPDEPKIFEMMPPPAPKPVEKPSPKKKTEARPKPSPKKPIAPPVQPPLPPQPKLFDKLLFDAIDISKLPNQNSAPESADVGNGEDSETAYGPGEGPGGERLYNAEWQREPTNAELAFYLPKGAPKGAWALIACRTIERFKVDDCRELGDSPPGSRLASAMREAAWQFRVRPPRVGGKPLVGAWVRIRISFSEEEDRPAE